MKKCLVLLLLVATCIGVTGGSAHAAESPQKVLTVSPAATKPVVKPGQTIRDKLQVINQGDAAYTVRIYATPYGVHGEEYKPDFTSVPGKPDITSWITFDTTSATVEKDKTLDVNYALTVPEDTEPGGYYLVAFAESKTDNDKQGVVVNQRVGEVFYIRVAGDVKEAGKIVSWNVPFLQNDVLRGDVRLQNDGGTHYSSGARMQVKDLFGGVKYEQISDKEVLPQTIRHIPLEWKDAPALGLFKVTGTVHVPRGDVSLSTKYVLVISPLFRVIFIMLILIVILFAAWKLLGRRGGARSARIANK